MLQLMAVTIDYHKNCRAVPNYINDNTSWALAVVWPRHNARGNDGCAMQS